MNSKLNVDNIFYYQTVDSTNLTALKHFEEGAPSFSVIVAEEQKQGRGRLGRSWFSPRHNGLWFSLLLRPDNLSPENASPITLVTAAVLAAYFNEKINLPVKIKWPNDLLLGEKKVGGILTEMKAEQDRIIYLIIGIGINVNQQNEDFPNELRCKATSLAGESGIRFRCENLLPALLDELIKAYKLFLNQGFAPFKQRWEIYNVTLGRDISIIVTGVASEESIKGTALGITSGGALRLRDHRGVEQIIHSGEIK